MDRLLPRIIFSLVALPAAAMTHVQAARWTHPAGVVTAETIKEIKEKIQTCEWAKRSYASRKEALDRWLQVPPEELRRVFPKKRGNVYHNFSCPKDRHRLEFDPLASDQFKCPSCGKTYAPDTDAGIYASDDRYHGTLYDGWACLFYEEAGSVAADLGLIGRIDGGEAHFRRGVEILLLYTDTVERLPTRPDKDPQMRVILTYHREGDNKVLNDLACAYELLRDHMTNDQRARFERVALRRPLDDVMLEPIYTYEHNNLYQWHRTIVQTALALEREDLIDWSFGYGAFDPAHQPEHRSIRRLAATHFKPDGAFWEMCSGYHLYPVHFFCELAVVSHHLARMDPQRFPPDRYDLTDRAGPGGKAFHAALEWFLAMAMPDRTMPTIGDSPASRAGMDDYYATAEVGYRFFGVKAVGDYESLRTGHRSWGALLYGVPQIAQYATPFTSSCLSSGWVSLRNDWKGNKVWVGLNALIPGGGHQHADRLTLLNYSHGKLLALEKATPYNESVTRTLGTLSQAHNTVTVDKTSQKQGEALKGEEIPKVAFFYAGPVAKFAELHGDHLYGQTTVYRRSVALIEDVIVDCFRVRGGKTHDWIVNHAGPAPRLSVPMTAGAFEPGDWLANGTHRVRHAETDNAWDAKWSVEGVTSRLTMMGAETTNVYTLETYPIANAVVTPKDPPCQTLCVRRHSDTPFLAVWDAWRDSPNLNAVSRGDKGESLQLQTNSNTYYILFGPGEACFENGVSVKSDAVFSIARNRDAVLFVSGTNLDLSAKEGTLRVAADKPATLSAEWVDGIVTLEIAGDIHYDTYAGQDHYRDAPPVTVTIEGDLWKIQRRRYRVAGRVRDAD